MGDTRPRSVFLEVQDLVMDLVEAGLHHDAWVAIAVAEVSDAERAALTRMASALGITPQREPGEPERHLRLVT